MRRKRLLAFLVDFMLLYLPCTLLPPVLLCFPIGGAVLLIITASVISFFVVFVLRDYLFHGHSIGKRLFKLRVVDAETLSEPTAKQLIVKNIFLFLYFDGLFLIFSGRSLGERASRTLVLHESQLPCPPDPQPASGKPSKRILTAVIAVLCIALPMFLIISMALESEKEQENYRIAYAYVAESDAFAETQVDPSQIILTGYSQNTHVDGDTVTDAVTFTFMVGWRQYQVVCHQNDGQWYVCPDCTDFQ